MRLSEDDLKLFYTLHPALLLYTNQQKNIIKNIDTIDELMNSDTSKKSEVMEALHKDRDSIITQFIEDKANEFSEDELAIVASWKDMKKGTFIILKQLKAHATILCTDNNMAYGVCALSDAFDELFYLPTHCTMTLLPFKDKIIYDGIIYSSRMSFGASIVKDFKESFDLAKAQYGLITSLPYVQTADSEKELLKFYVKNETNRDYYEEEILELVSKSESLKTVYHQALGKANARHISKRLREAGVEKGFFAILDNVIVASGKNKKEVEANVKVILPIDKVKYVYIYQLKR